MNRLLQSDTIRHAAHWIFAIKLFELSWSVLVEELIEGEVTSTNLDLNLVTNAAYPYALCAELVHSLRLTHEHDLELLSVGVVVDVLSQLLVKCIVLDWDIHGDASLQIDDVLAQLFDLVVGLIKLPLVLLHLLEHVQLHGLRLVEFLLELADVSRSAL